MIACYDEGLMYGAGGDADYFYGWSEGDGTGDGYNSDGDGWLVLAEDESWGYEEYWDTDLPEYWYWEYGE